MMKGFYHYDSHKGKYIWIIECMGVQVDSGECGTKSQMTETRIKHPLVSWSEY